MLGFGRTVLPMNYVKVWAHGFTQQEGRTKGREYLVSWWCSSPAKVASGEVGQQRRSQGHRGCRGRTPCRRWSRGRWAPGGARPSSVSSPGCGAASGWRRSAAGETSPRRRAKGRARLEKNAPTAKSARPHISSVLCIYIYLFYYLFIYHLKSLSWFRPQAFVCAPARLRVRGPEA
jgi:hypothetical protein